MDPVLQIKKIMRASCNQAYSVQHFCARLDMPYHTLRKLFRRREGLSLSKYWQRCRLQKAEELLSQNKYVFEVAYEMGFSSEGNFANWFKKQKGMTPREFQRRRRQAALAGRARGQDS